jgi:hypothetical protein
LAPYENLIHGHFQEIYNVIKDLSKEYPHKTFKELLSNRGFSENIKKALKQEQYLILGQVSRLSQKLSPDTRKKVKQAILDAKKIINDEDVPKKRKEIVRLFANIQHFPEEEDIYAEIYRTVVKFPSSETATNAFLAKYSRRKSNETVQRLIQKFCNTQEHIIPENNLKGPKGPTKPYNLIAAHGGCNNERAQKDYGDLIAQNPKIIDFMQQNVNVIAGYIQRGLMKSKYDNYPVAVKKTLFNATRGNIDIDISGFSIPVRNARGEIVKS